ncbi:protein kinase C delta type-like [Lithobates pipiens]
MTCYRILGEGSYGKVVLASHPAIDQKLAVKLVQKKRVFKANDCNAIFRERDILKAARESPFITHLFGSFQTENHLIFAMECLSRGDFFDTFVEGAPFPENTIRYFIAEMLCGLQFLHSKEIVHRDIKPENILLDDAGHIKIADLGLAVSGVTESKRIEGRAGTILYMAPEILQRLPYFGMADYYALGIIVYVMAVGGHPFLSCDESSEEILKKVTTLEPDYPEDMDTNLRDIIERFLCKDQEKRMRLVSEIREHPFLQMVDWKETENGKSPPPFPAGNLSEEDLSEGVPVDEFIQSVDRGKRIKPEKQKEFYGFTYVSERLKLQPVA